LSPCKPKNVSVDEEEKTARVVVEDEQIALAYGKGGQNLRLAVGLTGYAIEIVKESEVYQKPEEFIDIAMIDGLSDIIKRKLISNGFETAEDILDAGAKKIKTIPGIGEKTAEKIIAIVNSLYEEEN
jgi:transcription antitermination factor NusA-like protein